MTVDDLRRYDFDDDPERVDRNVVWAYLGYEAYWGRWRTREVVEQQLDASWRVVGAYLSGSGEMVGFARAISDGVALAYVADVFVTVEHRGHGVGRRLVEILIDEGPGAHFRWMLHTKDTHELYRRFGFTAPDETYLERPGRPFG